MKKFFIAFTIFIVWSVIGLGLYSWLKSGFELKDNQHDSAEYSNDVKEKINESIKLDKTETAPLTSIDSIDSNAEIIENGNIEDYELIAFTKDGDVIFKLIKGIIITKNSSELKIPETSNNFAGKLRSYMTENPNTEIHITSLYSAHERNESPNIGVQRGNELKEIMVNNGVSRDRIVVKSFIKPIEFSTQNSFSRSFSFQLFPMDTLRIQSLRKMNLENKIIYPEFTTTGIASNQNLKVFLRDIKGIIAENEGVIIELIGHTDNVGNANDNYILGLQYARQVKWYLINRGGIPGKNIKTLSKGESEPIDTNKTERGRDKNRRIEVNFITNQ